MIKDYRQTVYENALRRRFGGTSIQTSAFSWTDANQSFVVPTGVTSVTAYMWGGGGGMDTSAKGGAGGYASGTFTVTPGETLTVIVARGGHSGNSGGKTAAFGGGGAPAQYNSGGGGGRSAIQRSSVDIITAGGGGGSGAAPANGGPGGAPTSLLGKGVDGQNGATGGGGGTISAGGAGGAGSSQPGSPGTQYKGGDLVFGVAYVTGAGGGGYYGGGSGGFPTSGAGGGGGGGASYTVGLRDAVELYGTSGTAPNTGSLFYAAGVAAGAILTTSLGGPGRIVLQYGGIIFDPSLYGTLDLWLDAADVTGTGTNPANGTLSTWVNKSGLGSSATAVGTPTLVATGVNGKPGLSFNGTDAGFRGTTSNTGSVSTTFIVATLNSGTPVNGRLVSFADSVGEYDSATSVVPLLRDGSGQGILTYYNNTPQSSKSIPAYDTAFYATSLVDGTNNINYVNGVAGTTGAVSTTFAITKYAIGTQPVSNGDYWNGYVSEVLVYNSALSATNRAIIESYLKAKWGI